MKNPVTLSDTTPYYERHFLLIDHHSAPELRDWLQQAGTIFCDGAVRGSAVLATQPAADMTPSDLILVTAAHVFYDLELGQRWQRCFYHHQGMAARPGYRVPLRWEWVQTGDFNPLSNPSHAQQGAGDWAFVWLGGQWTPPEGTTGFRLGTLSAGGQPPFKLASVAWHSQRQQLGAVGACQGVWSGHDDLGGGLWSGQLLDDCDDADGASGGALLQQRNGSVVLVAVRGGSHHALESGAPEAGAQWNVQQRTNYARALDANVLEALDGFLRELADGGG